MNVSSRSRCVPLQLPAKLAFRDSSVSPLPGRVLRCPDSRRRSTLFTEFARGCPKTVTSAKFPEFTLVHCQQDLVIHSVLGITAQSGLKMLSASHASR